MSLRYVREVRTQRPHDIPNENGRTSTSVINRFKQHFSVLKLPKHLMTNIGARIKQVNLSPDTAFWRLNRGKNDNKHNIFKKPDNNRRSAFEQQLLSDIQRGTLFRNNIRPMNDINIRGDEHAAINTHNIDGPNFPFRNIIFREQINWRPPPPNEHSVGLPEGHPNMHPLSDKFNDFHHAPDGKPNLLQFNHETFLLNNKNNNNDERFAVQNINRNVAEHVQPTAVQPTNFPQENNHNGHIMAMQSERPDFPPQLPNLPNFRNFPIINNNNNNNHHNINNNNNNNNNPEINLNTFSKTHFREPQQNEQLNVREEVRNSESQFAERDPFGKFNNQQENPNIDLDFVQHFEQGKFDVHQEGPNSQLQHGEPQQEEILNIRPEIQNPESGIPQHQHQGRFNIQHEGPISPGSIIVNQQHGHFHPQPDVPNSLMSSHPTNNANSLDSTFGFKNQPSDLNLQEIRPSMKEFPLKVRNVKEHFGEPPEGVRHHHPHPQFQLIHQEPGEQKLLTMMSNIMPDDVRNGHMPFDHLPFPMRNQPLLQVEKHSSSSSHSFPNGMRNKMPVHHPQILSPAKITSVHRQEMKVPRIFKDFPTNPIFDTAPWVPMTQKPPRDWTPTNGLWPTNGDQNLPIDSTTSHLNGSELSTISLLIPTPKLRENSDELPASSLDFEADDEIPVTEVSRIQIKYSINVD